LRLSYATLGAFIKYPKESLPKKPTSHIADKKYGCFQSEKESFLDIVEDLGLLKKSKTADISYHRHPLTFLVEAADDICYTIIDFEDGINLGLIEEEFALEYLIKLVKNTIDIKKYHSLKFKKDRVSYLRALAINTLINEAVDIFLANESAILKGSFSSSLLEKCAYEAQINDIINISVSKIYKSQEVVEKEVAGYKIIADLLNIFVTAINNHQTGTLSNYDSLLLNLLPKEFMISSESTYERIMSICTYVSRMSDSYAIRIHKKIQGSIM
jgi:dGTPase